MPSRTTLEASGGWESKIRNYRPTLLNFCLSRKLINGNSVSFGQKDLGIMAILWHAGVQTIKTLREAENKKPEHNKDKTKTMNLLSRFDTTVQQHNQYTGDRQYTPNIISRITWITENNDKMIQRRNNLVTKTNVIPINVMEYRSAHRKTKILLYKAMIQPTLLYESKIWIFVTKS